MMNEEIMSIRSWVHDALKCAVNKRNEKQKVSEYDRGRRAGSISAYQHVMVETLPTSVWKKEYNVLNAWIRNITIHTPLTISDAIRIYDFCDRNDLLKRYNVVERVIELGLEGHTQYDITNLLKLEALKEARWIRQRWERKKYDE